MEYLASSKIGADLKAKSIALNKQGVGRSALDILVDSNQLGAAENMRRMLKIRSDENAE